MSAQRVALVTGGSGGIGRHVVKRLALDGCQVVFTYHRSDADAAAVVDECVSAGLAVEARQVDLADSAAVNGVFDYLVSEYGSVDVLIHAAAHVVFGSLPKLAGPKHEDYLTAFAVNTHALALALARCGQAMADGGRVVNISSLNASLGIFGSGAYAGSKAASEAITRAAARELGSRGITCNTVELGLVETTAMRNEVNQHAVDFYAMQAPVGRIGQPGDVAHLISHLASEESAWVSGQTIRLDGGYHF